MSRDKYLLVVAVVVVVVHDESTLLFPTKARFENFHKQPFTTFLAFMGSHTTEVSVKIHRSVNDDDFIFFSSFTTFPVFLSS